MYKHYLLILLACFSVCTLQAQVVINEFSAANHDDFLDNYDEYEDWVELYNTSNVAVDLTGYHLSDETNEPEKWKFPPGVSIPANGHLLIWCSNRDEVSPSGDIHSGFKITQTRGSEDIMLSDPTGMPLDSNKISSPNQRGHSWGRPADGDISGWSVFTTPTPGAPNTGARPEYTGKPSISPPAGFYSGSVTVEIEADSASASDVTIYYTTDGSTPGTGSNVYNGPFTINQTTVVKAISVDNDSNIPRSFADFHTFFVDDYHTVKAISISGDEIEDLMDGQGGAFGGSQFEPDGAFELFNEDSSRVADVTGEFNKHGNDSWAYDQRGIDFISRDEFGDDWAVKNEIFDMFNITNRDRFQRLILKAAANDNYNYEDGAHIRDAYIHTLTQVAGMNLDERTYEPCVLYVNGEYWGVYEIREKVDDNDFTKEYYDQGRNDLQFIKTWGNTWAEYGGQQALDDWEVLQDFIVNNDMSVPANYAQVTAELDVTSLVDYMIINTHAVCTDWLNYNTAWWRGLNPDGDPLSLKWRYIMWDVDASFGHYINYTGVPDDNPTADPCDNESPQIDDPEGHTDMLISLLENPDFEALYINRYADLNNTYFSCEYMNELLDIMIDRIEPEMPRQIARWTGGSMAGWMDNVQELRDFINTRCTVIDNGIEDCYDVEGPYNLTVIVEPPGAGDVRVNTIIPLAYPYEADYFEGIPITLEAIPAGNNSFDYWQPYNSTLNPNNTTDFVDFSITNLGDTIIAHFIEFVCPPINVIPNITNADCGNANGSASLIAVGGAGPYSYTWDSNANDQSTPTANNLPAGVYSVTVTDNNGCDQIEMITINNNAGDLTTTTSFTDANCTAADGTATVTATGTATPFTYQWDNGQTTATATGLAPGTYTVQVIDANNCITSETVTVGSIGDLSIVVNAADAACGAATGSAEVTLTGGAAPYTYQWSDGQTIPDPTLAPGTYTVIVVDANGCEETQQITIGSTSALSVQTSSSDISCFGQNDGSVSVVTPGTFDYLWSNGQTTSSINNLSAGQYTVTVTQAGCSDVQTVTINQPSPLSVNVNSESGLCSVNSSSATAFVSGGEPGYTYLWSTGQTGNSIGGLANGVYTVTVTDNNNCTTIGAVTVNATSTAPVLGASQTNVACNGDTNGSIDLSVNGGTPPFSYQWDNGSTSEDLSNLAPGSYAVQVSDANNCIAVISVIVSEPAVLGLIPDSMPSSGNDGWASVTVTGGIPPFSYQWSNGQTTQTATGLAPGTYTVVVTDANNCMITEQITVESFVSTINLENLTTFELYPNPSDGQFIINIQFSVSEKAGINIFSELGQKVYEYTGTQSSFTQSVDISEHPSGTYFVSLTTEKGRAIKKVLLIK